MNGQFRIHGNSANKNFSTMFLRDVANFGTRCCVTGKRTHDVLTKDKL